MKVLVIEDEKLVAESIRAILEHKGFEVETVYDGEAGTEYAELGIYDLLILDVMMPKLNGFQVAQQVRANRCHAPILMLTARSDLEDRIRGLNAGADYYLTKPFDTKELLARVAVRLRESARSPLAAVYTCGDLTLDTASHAVHAAGQPVQLTRTEYAILKLLMQHPGQVLAKSVLLDRISADTPDCTESSLKTHVSNLRGKLRAVSDRDYVEAVWGIGFRLAAEA